MITRVINQYEDEHSGRPYDPDGARVKNDGRIYPPGTDSEKAPSLYGDRCYRTRGHYVWIATNGAFVFQNVRTLDLDFSKPGLDGQEVSR